MSYDIKSYELAEYFLGDSPFAFEAQIKELAQYIQDTCEDYCEHLEEEDKNKTNKESLPSYLNNTKKMR